MKTLAKILIILGMVIGGIAVIPLVVGILALVKLNKAKSKKEIIIPAILVLVFGNILAGIVMLLISENSFENGKKEVIQDNSSVTTPTTSSSSSFSKVLIPLISVVAVIGIALLGVGGFGIYKLAFEKQEVSFNTNGGSIVETVKVKKNDKVLKPQDPVKEGHTFLGWYYQGQEWSFIGYSVTEDITLEAKWQINQYTITFDTDGGTQIPSITQDYGTEVKKPEEPVKKYANFLGWEVEFPITMPAENIVVKAIWDDYGEYKIETNEYEIDGTTIVKYTGDKKEIIIPAYYIKNGEKINITTIGNDAFSNNNSIEKITILDNIDKISNNAFEKCRSLTSVIIGNSVTSIGEYAFYNCDKLTSVIIGNSVTSIGEYAFRNCTSLASVVIPDSVTSIGEYAFYYCTSLTSITIPNSVTSIGEYTFSDCGNLTSITIPDSVTSIGDYAFRSCNRLTIYCEATSKPSGWNDDWNYNTRLVYWGINANDFAIVDNFEYVLDINSKTAILTRYIGDNDTLTIPNSIEHNKVVYKVIIIDDRAFEDCYDLLSVTISDSVTNIGEYAFYNCKSLTSITIGDSVTSIEDFAFENCRSLTNITIPDSVTSIGEGAFGACTSLASVIIGNSVTSIGEYAFYNCDKLTSVIIGNSVTSIGEYAFSNCDSLRSITIPDSVTSIGEYAFNDCDRLIIYCEATSIPSGWGYNWYYLTTPVVYWGINANVFAIVDNFEYVLDINSKTAILTRYIGDNDTLTIPNSIEHNKVVYKVITIGECAFSICLELTSITIPDSVTSIGDFAFRSCDITSITIPNSVTRIGNSAFYNCNSLTSITIPNSVTRIGEYAFHNCYSLTSITIPNSVTSIGEGAFYYCNSLTSVIIGNSVTRIGEYAFKNCRSLISISIPASVTSIGTCAFEYCTSLTNIIIPNRVTNIGYSAFSGCTSLTIYCEANSKPSGWSSRWNYSNRPVVWGYKGE